MCPSSPLDLLGQVVHHLYAVCRAPSSAVLSSGLARYRRPRSREALRLGWCCVVVFPYTKPFPSSNDDPRRQSCQGLQSSSSQILTKHSTRQGVTSSCASAPSFGYKKLGHIVLYRGLACSRAAGLKSRMRPFRRGPSLAPKSNKDRGPVSAQDTGKGGKNITADVGGHGSYRHLWQVIVTATLLWWQPDRERTLAEQGSLPLSDILGG